MNIKLTKRQWLFIVAIVVLIVVAAMNNRNSVSDKPVKQLVAASPGGHSKPCNIAKKDGSYESTRCNDLEELCKDYYYFRAKIIQASRNGNTQKAGEYRNSFNQINDWLSQYHDSDVQNMMSAVNR